MKTIISLIIGCVFCFQISAQVSCDPPPSGIVSWWPAEGNANDIISSNNGTVYGSLAYTNTFDGQAFVFDGSTSYISIPASTSLDIGNLTNATGVTIECWVRPQASCNAPIIEWDSSSSDGLLLWVANGASQLLADIRDTSGNVHALAWNTTFDTAHFQHVAVTYDKSSGNAALYYNGSVATTANLGSFTPQTSYPAYNANIGRRLGQPNGLGDTFAGLIDELSVYNRALSSNEIAAIYQAGSAGKCSGSGPPVITTQPTNEIAAVGTTASFSVTATGTSPLNYQWQFDVANLPGATNSTLVLSNLSLSQSGTYDVVVTNYAGSVTSTPAVLTVMFILVEVNGQSDTNTVTAVSPATVTILGGYPNGFIFYTLDGSTPTVGSTLYTGPFILTNSAEVQTLAVSSTNFTQTTSGIPVTVQVVPAYTLQTSITGSGTLSTNPPGGVYASNTVVTLTATPASHWSFVNWTNDATGNQNPLSVTMNGPRNIQAVFVQTAFPLTLSTPGGGTVTANGAVIGASTYYTTDSIVTLNATPASGWSFLGWQGTVNSTNNPLNLVITQTNNIQGIFGTMAATNAVGGAVVMSQPNPIPYGTALTVSAVPDTGNYLVNWSGAIYTYSANPTRYTVTAANPTLGALFTPLPTGKLTLTAVVNGPGFVTLSPQANYYSSNATVTLTPSPNTGAYFFGWTLGATGRNNPLTVQVTSNTVIQANFGVAPIVSISPLNQTVFAGSNAVITASDMGQPPLTNQWWNGQGIIPGATNTTLIVSNIQPASASNYWVVVSSSAGSVTSAVATVTVISSPSITNQPTPSTVVTVGHAASFNVGAYGAPTLAYQWQLNGTNVAGATNTALTFSNAFPANGGAYTVTVTNVFGSATSYPALLTVLPLDIIVPAKLSNGQFQFTFDTATGINYQVQYSTNLLNWYLWLTVGGNGQPLTLTDPNTTGIPERFYRIALSPQ